ncbi:uncharacterized protein LOC134291190 [Aedes albopictus]|uniref:Secreted protein n=1 Tax=Aedes albopictus TaxID=7160 RepID=A0ABM2A2B2_AEDAL
MRCKIHRSNRVVNHVEKILRAVRMQPEHPPPGGESSCRITQDWKRGQLVNWPPKYSGSSPEIDNPGEAIRSRKNLIDDSNLPDLWRLNNSCNSFLAPTKLVPLSEHSSSGTPRRDTNLCSAAMNASDVKFSTASRWIPLVTMQKKTQTYPFTGAAFLPVCLMKKGPAKSNPTLWNAGARSQRLEGRSPMRWSAVVGFTLKQRTQLRVTLRTAERPCKIQTCLRKVANNAEGPICKFSRWTHRM